MTLKGIQFTKHFIEFVLVETNQLLSSDSSVILAWQTCGQRLGMPAGGKRRALAFNFSIRMSNIFLISKCRRGSDLGLCMTLGLAKRMPLHSADFRFSNVFGRKIFRKSARSGMPRSGIHFANPKVMHRPKSDYHLHFDDLRNI